MKPITKLLYPVVLVVLGNSLLLAAERGTLVREAVIYLSPDTTSNKLSQVERGQELILLEKSPHWLHVEALLSSKTVDPAFVLEEDDEGKTISGWVVDTGVVWASTANGDRILFGAAVDSEDEASRRHGRRGAGERRYLREGINEESMRLVMKKFPDSKWAQLAAFHLIDNKLCGDWQGSSKCPDKEAEMYEKYVKEHPESPAAPEALYDAAYRRSALIEIYKTEEQPKKSEQSKGLAISLAQQLISQYSQSDWSARGQMLLFLIQQEVPTYGNAIQ